jgi:hypothetical protein
MDGPTLQNLISKGLGVAARRLGSPFVVYRPRGVADPLQSRNKVISLSAAFNAEDESFRRVAGYGDAVWWGVFDSCYTKPGDYLSGLDVLGNPEIFFISAERPLLPVQCVRTNRVVCVLRPPSPPSGGYGGFVLETAAPVIEAWPASLLAQGARVSGALPETRFGNWTLLLPTLPAEILVGDVVRDDLGRSFLVASAEFSELGWRMIVRQVAA